jgi:two-component system, OmpR family, sensor histidine kinase MprB
MLRTRFTLAVAGAVAAVALAVTAVAFLVVRADLQHQVQHELRQQAAVVERLARHYHGHIPAGWVPADSDRFGASTAYAQVVTAQGAVWAPPGDGGLLPGTAAATQVAAGQRGSYYTETTLAGVHAMVLTTPLAPGLAVQLAVPVNVMDQELGSIGAMLALLSAAGIGLAALAGWGVARAGLAPVGRLAGVAEEVTATGDVGRRVEVGRADELGRLAASFNTMLEALQRSVAAQRQLVSDAGHELRTPLTSMRVNVELLAAEPGLPDAERRQVLDRVVAQVAELGRLVANVTDLARGEPLPGRFEEVSLDEVVAAALAGARRDWPRIDFAADLEPGTVAGRPERLTIAVRNLLDNAAKFSPPGGQVQVRLRAGELTVRDHGAGIPSADLSRVFDRFYRAPSARAAPGSGLGLSIVRQVADSHGGAVSAEPAPGGGTLMRFRLPATPARMRALARAGPLPGRGTVADDGPPRGRGGTHAVPAEDSRHPPGDPRGTAGRGVQAVTRAGESPPRGQRVHDDHVAVRGARGRHDRAVGPVGGRRARPPGEDGQQRDPRPRCLGADQGQRLLDPAPFQPGGNADVVVPGLHDDQRRVQRGQAEPRDLGGDRPVAPGTGPHVARAGHAVHDGVPVQPPGQQHRPGPVRAAGADPGGERGAGDRQARHASSRAPQPPLAGPGTGHRRRQPHRSPHLAGWPQQQSDRGSRHRTSPDHGQVSDMPHALSNDRAPGQCTTTSHCATGSS